MIKSFLTLCFIGWMLPSWGQQTPFLEPEKFEITLDYSFKKREEAIRDVVYVDRVVEKSNQAEAFVILKIHLVHLGPEAVRMRLEGEGDVVLKSRKLKQPEDHIILPIGFVGDLKRKEGGAVFTVMIIDAQKNKLGRIKFQIKQNGDFLVNEEVFGRL
jgi:hypothetical protein